MTWSLLASSLPLFLPAACWTAGCQCDWLCPMAGMTGCIALSALASAVLFAALAFIREMAALKSIHD